jgi:hypothetical protein
VIGLTFNKRDIVMEIWGTRQTPHEEDHQTRCFKNGLGNSIIPAIARIIGEAIK